MQWKSCTVDRLFRPWRWTWVGLARGVAATALIAASFTASMQVPTANARGSVQRGLAAVWVSGQGRVRLHVEDRGEGPALVLLHGLGASSYVWRRIVGGLARDHRVIAIDLKGFGRSDKPEDGRYAITDQARLVHAVLQARGIAEATFVGHSLGGAVTLALALQTRTAAPGLVQRMVLIAAPGLPQALPDPIELLRRPGLGEIALDVAPPELIARLTLESATLDASRITADDIAAYAAPLAAPGGRQALIATARAIDPDRFAPLIRRYPTLTIPTLLLWCRGDRIVPLSTGQRLARRLPRARLEVMEACNHVAPEEKPAETLARIRAFLARR